MHTPLTQRASAAVCAAFLTLVMLVGVNSLATAQHPETRQAQVMPVPPGQA